ncbi:MAG: hypothetical protein QHJ34_15345 [bacterium]|jgi:hypothetical protein|nr:hypothetical protein [candidate division KSB1 bacterium]MDH7561578.1 hypothetical protein [bacterium]
MRREQKSFAFPVGTFVLFVAVLLLSLRGTPHERRLVVGVQLTEPQMLDSLLATARREGSRVSTYEAPMGRVFHLVECQGSGAARVIVECLPPGTENVAASSVLMAHAGPQGWRPDVVLAMTLCDVANTSPGDIALNSAWAIGHSGRLDGHGYRPEELWTWDPTLQEARPARFFWSNQRLLAMAVDSYLRLRELLVAEQRYTAAGSPDPLPRLHLDRVGVSTEMEFASSPLVDSWQEVLANGAQDGLRLLPGSTERGLAAAAKVFQESGIPFAGAAVSAPAEPMSTAVALASRFLWTWIGEVTKDWGPVE